MLIKTVFILLFMISAECFAQLEGQELIDSLEAEIPNLKRDTNAVNLYVDLSFRISFSDPSKGIKYGYKALNLSKEIEWRIGEAQALINLGVSHSMSGDDTDALKFFNRSLDIYKELDDKSGISSNYGNLGLIYWNQGDYQKALEFNKRSLDISKDLNDSVGIARTLSNIGLLYSNLGKYFEASEAFHRALNINEELGSKQYIAYNYNNLGLIKFYQDQYREAIEYFEKSLVINQEKKNLQESAVNLANIGQMYSELGEFEKAKKFYQRSYKINMKLENQNSIVSNLINIVDLNNKLGQYQTAVDIMKSTLAENYDIIGKREKVYSCYNMGESYFGLNKIDSSIKYTLKAVDEAEQMGLKEELYDIYLLAYKGYKKKNDLINALEYHEKFSNLKDSIFSEDVQTKIANLDAKRLNELKDKKLQIQELEIDRSNTVKIALGIGLLFLAIIVSLVIIQRQRSEKLLLNILPKSIADRLKAKEYPIADHFDNTTVVFIDIVGFTAFAQSKTPEEVVSLLNGLFTGFDNIADKYGLEKIKTIGDGYMAVAGLPEPNKDHALLAAKFAVECVDSINKYNKKHNSDFKVRIGVETGPVVAGVIGEKKFIYDLWGDTVNTASRMESYGVIDKIHSTEHFKNELEKRVSENGDFSFSFESREPIEVKGKGTMTTYLLILNN